MAEESGKIEIAGSHSGIDDLRGRATAGANAPRNDKVESYLARIAESSERAAESGEVPPLPDRKEDQRKLVMRYVEQIESNDAPITPLPNFALTNETYMRAVNSLLSKENCDKEVKREAIARLRLQNCFAIATAIPGRSQDAAIFLLQSFQQAESKKWGLEGRDFSLFLKEGLPGLKVGEAFALLQKGYTTGIEIGGQKINLGDDKLPAEEIERATSELEAILGGGKEAKKSLQLAFRVAKATLETSVWNKNLLGSDPLAEAIYFKDYRTKRANAARDRGPDITIGRIEGFGTSYFRSAQTLDKIKISDPERPGQPIKYPDGNEREFNSYLFLSQSEMHPAYLTRLSSSGDRILRTKARNRLDVKNSRGQDITKYISVDDMDFNRIKSGDYVGWLGIMVPRILSFKSLLLQTAWTPKDINSDAVEGFIAPSQTSDPEEVQRLRPEFVVGILGSILSKPEEASANGWDAIRIRGLLRVLTANFKTDNGNVPAFITNEQKDWAIKVLKEYGIDLWHSAAMIGVRQVISKRGIEI